MFFFFLNNNSTFVCWLNKRMNSLDMCRTNSIREIIRRDARKYSVFKRWSNYENTNIIKKNVHCSKKNSWNPLFVGTFEKIIFKRLLVLENITQCSGRTSICTKCFLFMFPAWKRRIFPLLPHRRAYLRSCTRFNVTINHKLLFTVTLLWGTPKPYGKFTIVRTIF